jgi:hypothetical protein
MSSDATKRSDGDKYLGIYLNDHLAGATAGLELARRAQGANEGTQLGVFLTQLVTEIDEDREVLQAVMAKLDVSRDSLKVAFGWATEKAGRLKLNGQITGYSPLSRVVELEGLSIGVDGKKGLWRMLRELEDPRLSEFDFDALAARAQEQRDELERRRIDAGLAAFEAAPKPAAAKPASKPKASAAASKAKSARKPPAAKAAAKPK